MNRWFNLMIGPEIYWLAVAGLMYLFGTRNSPATESGSRFLEQFLWWLPLVFVPAVFLCFLFPGAKWWLLFRINVATMVGLLAAVWIVCGAIDYRDSRNSGVGSGFIASLSLGSVLLLGLDLLAVGVLWWKSLKVVELAR
ncbi:MAG: hypothetical protein U1F61_00290 [Opitutaceae bacterium]